MRFFIGVITLFFIVTHSFADSVVNLSEELRLNEAIIAIESISLESENMKIYNLSGENNAIGIPIHNLPWRKALELILLYNHLIMEEKAGTIIVNKEVTEQSEQIQVRQKKQVQITSTAFIADKNFLKSLGIDWSTLLRGEVSANVSFSGAQQVPSDLFQVSGSQLITGNNMTLDINTMLKVIESNQLGKIIANPSILVSSGKKGFIQVGQDFSLKSKDESGNTTDQFYSAGIILDVTPKIIEQDGEEVIEMEVTVERSSVVPGSITTVINKSTSTTDLILYDGEETVIGGLYDTQETVARNGIPILKDLPWWCLGIRYLTGFNKKEVIERELVIILKAEIMQSAVERMRKEALEKSQE